jgi:hypothetical protein
MNDKNYRDCFTNVRNDKEIRCHRGHKGHKLLLIKFITYFR